MGFSGVPIIDMILPERGRLGRSMRAFLPALQVGC
jgi:hypothetical protein